MFNLLSVENFLKFFSLITEYLTVPGQVLATQAAVEAALSAAVSRDETEQIRTEEESMEGEPQHKRQALSVDFTTLVKEADYDAQQVMS